MQEKSTLQPIESPESLDELKEAVKAVSLEDYMSAETEILETLDRVYNNLPEEAKPEYVRDSVLLRRINSLRRQFNEWKGRAIRDKKMPRPMEAGPSKYPVKKLRKRQRSERNASEELDEKKKKVKAGAKGARQRALEAIGSSVAEQNEKRRQSKREKRREQLSKGAIVQFRNPSLRAGRVVRVNKKTVTVEYERERTHNPLTGEKYEDQMANSRVELESEFLDLVDADTLQEAQEQISGGGE
jgi:hypothetical protein